MLKTFSTDVNKTVLEKVAKNIFKLDNPNLYLKKVVRLMNDRNNMFFKEDKIDWAIAELLAYGTLLDQNYNVRISGQDVERGTFSHRHAILKTEKTEKEFIPLNNISKDQYEFQVLHGVPMQKKLEMLMNEGNTVRVYLPYGDNWYDYSVRRLKENPKMAGYIIKNLLLSIFRIK